jgi:hypothetical protein
MCVLWGGGGGWKENPFFVFFFFSCATFFVVLYFAHVAAHFSFVVFRRRTRGALHPSPLKQTWG